MSELNNIWKNIKEIQKLVEGINKDWEKCVKSKLNLISEYALEREVQEAKSCLIDLVIEQTLDKHGIRNVIVSDRDKESLEKKDFDERDIEEYITEKYIKRADELAFKEILSQAKTLLPRFWEGYEPRKPTIDDIVNGKKLILKVYWHYSTLDWGVCEYINALEKLIWIAIKNKKPSQAVGYMGGVVNRVGNYDNFGQAKRYEYDNGIIKSFRIYKNGKLEIQFYKEKDARKVAELLISDNNDYGNI